MIRLFSHHDHPAVLELDSTFVFLSVALCCSCLGADVHCGLGNEDMTSCATISSMVQQSAITLSTAGNAAIAVFCRTMVIPRFHAHPSSARALMFGLDESL